MRGIHEGGACGRRFFFGAVGALPVVGMAGLTSGRLVIFNR